MATAKKKSTRRPAYEVIPVGEDYRVIIRPGDLPEWKDGLAWQAELRRTKVKLDDYDYPLAIAWVAHFRGDDDGLPDPDFNHLLQFILVPDGARRCGYGMILLWGCCKKWPGLDLGTHCSDEGAALLEAFDRESHQDEAGFLKTVELRAQDLSLSTELRAIARRIEALDGKEIPDRFKGDSLQMWADLCGKSHSLIPDAREQYLACVTQAIAAREAR